MWTNLSNWWYGPKHTVEKTWTKSEIEKPKNFTEETITSILKCAILGASGVGKTNFFQVLQNETPELKYVPTISSDFGVLTYRQTDRHTVKIQIWDVCGADRMSIFTRSYLKGSNIVFLMFDLTDSDSLEKLNNYKDIVQEEWCKEVIVLGNKSDLVSKRKISKKEAEAFALKMNAQYFETNHHEKFDIFQHVKRSIDTHFLL